MKIDKATIEKLADKADEIIKAIVSDKDFKKFIEDEVKANFEIIETGTAKITPRLVVNAKRTPESDWEVAVFGFMLDEHRHDMMRSIGKMYATETEPESKRTKFAPPVVVTLTTEAWTASFESREAQEAFSKSGKMIADLPADKRKEVLIVTGITIDKRQLTAQTEILRDEKGMIKMGKTQWLEKAEAPILIRFYEGYAEAMAKKYSLEVK